MFTVDANYNIRQYLSQFFASQIINTEWLEPGDKVNVVYPTSSSIDDGAGHAMITSYAVLRPDKQWSIMLVNRSQDVSYKVNVVFGHPAQGDRWGFRGPVETNGTRHRFFPCRTLRLCWASSLTVGKDMPSPTAPPNTRPFPQLRKQSLPFRPHRLWFCEVRSDPRTESRVRVCKVVGWSY